MRKEKAIRHQEDDETKIMLLSIRQNTTFGGQRHTIPLKRRGGSSCCGDASQQATLGGLQLNVQKI